MHIHIFGASGSGVTTLGQELSLRIAMPYFDADDYYWLPTDPPFQTKRDPAERNSLLKNDLNHHDDWVLGGSLDTWDNEFQSLFNWVVFLWIPTELRIERLKQREIERYGQHVLNDPIRRQQSDDFINWAAEYDSGLLKGRSKPRHEAWIQQLPCPVIRIEGDLTVEERIAVILKEL